MLVNARMMTQLNGMDEDFFLYYEEVALCHSARSRGWRVEFDESVQVIHRHPLQNRAITPKMRVITRHSKLLYFRKYLPRWQFLALSWIVTTEASIRGTISRVRGDAKATRAWMAIAHLARRFRAGQIVKGSDMLPLAEGVELGPASGMPFRARPKGVTDRQATGEPCHTLPAVTTPTSASVSLGTGQK
jgi:hypothetical protein